MALQQPPRRKMLQVGKRARSVLKELADARGAAVEYHVAWRGLPHDPLFSAQAQWRDRDGRVMQGGLAQASRKDDAREAAARGLLSSVQAGAAPPAPAPAQTPLWLLNDYLHQNRLRASRAESTAGPDHKPSFTIAMTVGKHSGHGTGATKKEAKHNAAHELLMLLEKSHGDNHQTVDAWCGLKAIALLVGLLGRKARLGAKDVADVLQQLVRKKAMHVAETQTPATGARIEAVDVGAALLPVEDLLVDILLAAMQPHDQARLLNALERSSESAAGPNHARTFAAVVVVGAHSSVGAGATKQKAEHDAVRKVLMLLSNLDTRVEAVCEARNSLHPLMGAYHGTAVEAVDAWCGDRAAGLLTALLGRKVGLSAAGLDKLEREVFSNKAMHDAATQTHDPRLLGSKRATGTRIEAGVGAALQPAEDRVIELLQSAMRPQDLARLFEALDRRLASN